jgi:hypothetical protein
VDASRIFSELRVLHAAVALAVACALPVLTAEEQNRMHVVKILADVAAAKEANATWIELRPENDDVVAAVLTLPGIEHLTVSSQGIGDDAWVGVEKLTKLKTLVLLGFDPFPVDLIEKLTKVESLRSLRLIATQGIHDNAMAKIAALSQLTRLNMENLREVSRQGFIELSKLKRLEVLELREEDGLDDALVQSLGFGRSLAELQVLRLDGRKLGDASLVEFSKLKKLEELQLGPRHATDKGVVALGEASQLRAVWLSGSERVTDEGITKLLERAQIDGIGLHFMKNVKGEFLSRTDAASISRLNRVSLSEMDGIAVEALEGLRNAKALKSIQLTTTKHCTDDVVKMLSELPNLEDIHMTSCEKLTVATAQSLLAAQKLTRAYFFGVTRTVKDEIWQRGLRDEFKKKNLTVSLP